MLMGEFHHNIDDKNRLIIPSKFREELGEKFVVTRGLDGCLFVYPENEWELIVKKIKTLPFTKKDARSFTRFFFSGATLCEFDKQGRIRIEQPLVDYSNIEKECVIIGALDRLEIWSKNKWDETFEMDSKNSSEIAEDLFDLDMDI